MRTTRFITITALFTALLIGVQFALSGVAGVELVTVFFLAFCFCAGIKAGVTVAITFSTIRCFLFGFYPSVIVLYLVYYVSFALFFGFLGNKFGRKITVSGYIAVLIFVCIFTACFSLLDDVITPIFYGFTLKSAIAYFYASLPFMLSQTICAFISVSVLFIPLIKIFSLGVGNLNKNDRSTDTGDEKRTD